VCLILSCPLVSTRLDRPLRPLSRVYQPAGRRTAAHGLFRARRRIAPEATCRSPLGDVHATVSVGRPNSRRSGGVVSPRGRSRGAVSLSRHAHSAPLGSPVGAVRPIGLNLRRAGCGERRTSGSEGGAGNPAGRKRRAAPSSDPTPTCPAPSRDGIGGSTSLGTSTAGRWWGGSWRGRKQRGWRRHWSAYRSASRAPARDRLTLHAGHGAAMASQRVAALLEDLGVTQRHARPHTSNDHPFWEAPFTTLKLNPTSRTGSPVWRRRADLRRFVAWYNTEHRHSRLRWMTPATVHQGEVAAVQARRDADILQHEPIPALIRRDRPGIIAPGGFASAVVCLPA
jgi:hypothetical protein